MFDSIRFHLAVCDHYQVADIQRYIDIGREEGAEIFQANIPVYNHELQLEVPAVRDKL